MPSQSIHINIDVILNWRKITMIGQRLRRNVDGPVARRISFDPQRIVSVVPELFDCFIWILWRSVSLKEWECKDMNNKPVIDNASNNLN